MRMLVVPLEMELRNALTVLHAPVDNCEFPTFRWGIVGRCCGSHLQFFVLLYSTTNTAPASAWIIRGRVSVDLVVVVGVRRRSERFHCIVPEWYYNVEARKWWALQICINICWSCLGGFNTWRDREESAFSNSRASESKPSPPFGWRDSESGVRLCFEELSDLLSSESEKTMWRRFVLGLKRCLIGLVSDSWDDEDLSNSFAEDFDESERTSTSTFCSRCFFDILWSSIEMQCQ